MNNLAFRVCKLDDSFSQLKYSTLVGIAYIYGTNKVIPTVHHPYYTIDHVVHITEASRLVSVTPYGDFEISFFLSFDRLATHRRR